MTEPYVLTVVPKLLPEGQFQGHLEYVEFKADNGKTSHLWWSIKTDTLVDNFARLMPRAEAYAIVAALRRGETVIVPGYWALSDIQHGFRGSGEN